MSNLAIPFTLRLGLKTNYPIEKILYDINIKTRAITALSNGNIIIW